MTPDNFEHAARHALLEREIARVAAGLARQVEEAVSFRDAVGRALTWLLDDVAPQEAPRVPAARAGGSESLFTRPSTNDLVDPLDVVSEALEQALLLRSPGVDPPAVTRIAGLVLQAGQFWLDGRATQSRQRFIDQTVELAVAKATPVPAFMAAQPKV